MPNLKPSGITTTSFAIVKTTAPTPRSVVNIPGAPADGWDIPRFGKTVPEDDPDYPSDIEVVAVVYELSFVR
jgi:hypothetical protein